MVSCRDWKPIPRSSKCSAKVSKCESDRPIPIEPPDRQHIAFVQRLHQLVELWPFLGCARHLIDGDLFAARRLQGVTLQAGILI
jgi:hypothetical protein